MDKKFKVFVIVALVVLAALAATGTVVALKAVNSTQGKQTEVEDAESKNIKILALKEAITTNLAGDENSRSMARISVGFGIDSEDKMAKDFETAFTDKELIVRNEVISILRAQTYEMMTRHDAQDKLAEEIKGRVNKILETEIIKEVYFGEFFVQ